MSQEDPAVDSPNRDPTNRLAFLPVVAYGTGIAALLAYILYFAIFKRMPPGGPESWGQFGDYFGGVVNSVAGIVAVFLVYFTLKVTRMEARDTREKMQLQLDALADQQRLTDLHRRLDGVMGEWRTLIEERTFSGYADPGIANETAKTRWRLMFNNETFYDRAKAWRDSAGGDAVREDLTIEFQDAIDLLGEIQLYCASYDKIAKNRDLTDFYRRRVSKAVRLLCTWGILSDEFRRRMFVASIALAEAEANFGD